MNLDQKYPESSRVFGKVVHLTDYGAFVALEEGIEGLVHVSQMSWARHTRHPSKIVNIGDTIEAVVLSVDKERKRISLGMKQLAPNPWSTVDERYPVGSEVEGKVRNLTDFGVFIALEEGIDGLIHISDLSWTQRVKHTSEVLKKGQLVKAVVLHVDKDNERLSLGLKQLQSNPWSTVDERYPLGSEVEGHVVRFIKDGAFVALDESIDGFIHISDLSWAPISHPSEVLTIGQRVQAVVLYVDKENKRLMLGLNEGV